MCEQVNYTLDVIYLSLMAPSIYTDCIFSSHCVLVLVRWNTPLRDLIVVCQQAVRVSCSNFHYLLSTPICGGSCVTYYASQAEEDIDV